VLQDVSTELNSINISDLRPDDLRKSRVIELDASFIYLGDEGIQPAPMDLVRAAIARSLPTELRLQKIELTRLDFGFWSKEHPRIQHQVRKHIFLDASVGANLVGNLVGNALSHALISSLPTGIQDAAIAYVELKIGPHSVTSAEIVPIREPRTPTQALELATNRALRSISEKVDAMKYWEQKP